MVAIVLAHSPLTGPQAWGRLPDALRTAGATVVVLDTDDRTPPYAARYVADAARQITRGRPRRRCGAGRPLRCGLPAAADRRHPAGGAAPDRRLRVPRRRRPARPGRHPARADARRRTPSSPPSSRHCSTPAACSRPGPTTTWSSWCPTTTCARALVGVAATARARLLRRAAARARRTGRTRRAASSSSRRPTTGRPGWRAPAAGPSSRRRPTSRAGTSRPAPTRTASPRSCST